jgi:hypothetical protein
MENRQYTKGMKNDGWVFCPKKEWKDRIKKATE